MRQDDASQKNPESSGSFCRRVALLNVDDLASIAEMFGLRQEGREVSLVEDGRQFNEFAFQCDGQAHDREKVRKLESKFNIAHVSLRNSGPLGDRQLREPTLHADLAHAFSE